MIRQLVTNEDIKNELGWQLEQLLGETPQMAQKWLERVQREVLNYIAKYAYGGMAQVEYYLCNANKKAIIREAIIAQVIFLKENNFVDAKSIANLEVANKIRDISPEAHEILENNGLLYCGASAWC